MVDEFSGWSSVPNWVIRSNKLQGSEVALHCASQPRECQGGVLAFPCDAGERCWHVYADGSSEVG